MFVCFALFSRSRNSVVGIMTRLKAGHPVNSDLIPGRSERFVSSPKSPDNHYGPPSLLWNEYWRDFFWAEGSWSVKLATHLHLVARLRMRVVIYWPLSKPLYHAKGQLLFTAFSSTSCMFHPSSYSLVASSCQNWKKYSMFPNYNDKQIRRIPSTWHLLYRTYITDYKWAQIFKFSFCSNKNCI